QLVLLLVLGDNAAGVAHATLITTGALTGGAVVLEFPRARAAVVGPLTSPPAAIVAALTVGGLILRLLASRGLWLDEATEVSQARLPYGAMLHQLATTDVHPPLHHTVLWLTVRVLGYALASVALIYNQYFSVLLVLTQQAVFTIAFIRGDRRILRGWLGSMALIALLVVPLLPFALEQFRANEAAGKGFEGVPSQAG